jgi:hypothetical protein
LSLPSLVWRENNKPNCHGQCERCGDSRFLCNYALELFGALNCSLSRWGTVVKMTGVKKTPTQPLLLVRSPLSIHWFVQSSHHEHCIRLCLEGECGLVQSWSHIIVVCLHCISKNDTATETMEATSYALPTEPPRQYGHSGNCSRCWHFISSWFERLQQRHEHRSQPSKQQLLAIRSVHVTRITTLLANNNFNLTSIAICHTYNIIIQTTNAIILLSTLL